jgi:predicted membrane-bound spermidine synthase
MARHRMDWILGLLFLLSGFSALVFETLWFRQAGLMLGNSVVASSLVLASFMGGLALGNALAARRAGRLARPIVGYALLELLVGASGVGLVLLFPALTPALAGLFGEVSGHPLALNGLRLSVTYGLMLVPATAMGATLPVVVRALCRAGSEFGWSLGRLYAWNTLGGVLGALAADAALIEALGVRGTGLLAGSVDVAAALIALGCARRWPLAGMDRDERGPLPVDHKPLLAAAFLGGFILLALEVVWFRLIQLWVLATSLGFSLMLSVVLVGIAAGGALAGLWSRFGSHAQRYASLVALLAGAVAALSYSVFADTTRGYASQIVAPGDILRISIPLMLPTCVLSGVLFTLLGKALNREPQAEARTTGWLTLANTLGAMLGSLCAGFLLLPRLGIETSIFVLAAAYLAAAALIFAGSAATERLSLRATAAAALAFAVLVGAFPFGLMRNQFVRSVAHRWASDGSRPLALREGQNETLLYLRKDLFGEPVHYRLITNAHSMSGSLFVAERYMRTFVWWPLALRPDARRALLISFGVGGTAEALTESRGLESIDVVDISKDVLEMGRLVFAPPRRYPLDDPRVHVHIEDGRFFLLSSRDTYDLITAEPPPPRNAQIVNLYSKEYFRLLHDHLAPGGIATYWLPVAQLYPPEAMAISRAFCDAFEDCTLWAGAGAEWMLAGTRGPLHAPSEADFTRQWRDETVRRALRAAGLEEPELLGSMFIGDAVFLHQFSSDNPPLDDDHPYRLSWRTRPAQMAYYFNQLAVPAQNAERFGDSTFVRDHWPPALRERTLERFPVQDIIDRYFWSALGGPATTLQDVHYLLTRTRLETPVLWLLGTSTAEVSAVGRAIRSHPDDPALVAIEAAAALAQRDYRRAEALFARIQDRDPAPDAVLQKRVLSLALAGDRQAAASLMRTSRGSSAGQPAWTWLAETFALPAAAKSD